MTSNSKKLAVIVLAAGMGKRMNTPDKAKVMALINDKPLIHHVLDKIKNLNLLKIVVIVGYKKESVIEFLNNYDSAIIQIEQKQQLGTGHAVAQAKEEFKLFNGDILILCGDVPNLSTDTLKKFITQHYDSGSDISVLSTITTNPFGYGRIIRNQNNDFIKIVEEKDANENEKKVNEINSGVYIVNSELLFDSLNNISNNNAQNEYYLTDIIDVLKTKNYKVSAFAVAEFDELLGVNSQEDLDKAKNYFLKNIN